MTEATHGPPTRDRVAAALRVAGVPVRLEILRAIADADGPVSPSGWVQGGAAGVTLREAAYHFRYLRDAGLIVLHEVRIDSGTAQHLYVTTPIGRALVDVLPRLERAAVADAAA
ncbi:MAG TPA: hypothetical protein VHF89_04500 [Solirubrobacteraceae bacterium]|nr:hypothetical protein [Solirubrobacteraceae bacterium]